MRAARGDINESAELLITGVVKRRPAATIRGTALPSRCGRLPLAQAADACRIPRMTAILSRLTPSRRWLQFSLRTMLFFTLVCAVFVGRFIDRARRQKQAADEIVAEGGMIVYRHEVLPAAGAQAWLLRDASAIDREASPAPAWLCRLLGEEFFLQVVAAKVNNKSSKHSASRLDDLPDLEELDVRSVYGSGYAHLGGLPHLKRLAIDAGCGPVRLKYLKASNGLESLNILGLIEDSDLAGLEQFSNLRSLWLSSPGLTSRAFRRIARLPKLEELYMHGPCFVGGGAKSLAAMTHLKTLSLEDPDGSAEMSAAVLAHLEKLPHLESLRLFAPIPSRTGLLRLNNNLLSLELGPGAGLARASRAGIVLGSSGAVSDAELAAMARLSRLESLILCAPTSVTDQGLTILNSMPRLKEVDFTSPHVTPQGIRALQAANPACRIVIRN